MKKILPLVCVTVLATACGTMNYGSCSKPSCCDKREPLSMRSFGSPRLNNAIVIQYNDQDYKGKKSCCAGMKGEQKKEVKKARKATTVSNSGASSFGVPAAAKAEEKPKKSGWFF